MCLLSDIVTINLMRGSLLVVNTIFGFSVAHNPHKPLHETHGHRASAGHEEDGKEGREPERKGTVRSLQFLQCRRKLYLILLLMFLVTVVCQFTIIRRDMSIKLMVTNRQAHLGTGREGRRASIKVYPHIAACNCCFIF